MNNSWRSSLIVIAIVSIVAMTVATIFDQSVTAALAEHERVYISVLMGRSLFEGEVPGPNDPMVFVLLASLIIYIIGWRSNYHGKWVAYRPQTGFILISALVIAFLIVNGIKWSFGRARPDLVLQHGWPFSTWFTFGPHFIANGPYRGAFPSGHTSQAFSGMSIAYVLICDPFYKGSLRRLGWTWGAFFLLLSITMGVVRCTSLSHWLTDVVGAICLGWLAMHLIYYWLLFVPVQRRYFEKHGGFPNLPKAWDLRMGGLMILTTAGIILLINGLRAILLQQSFWMASLIPVGGGLIYWMIQKTVRIRSEAKTLFQEEA